MDNKFLYDIEPYINHTFPATHPRNLAAIAFLYGMKPAAVDNCRVLELACGRGGNMIALAHDYPGSHFVGIDKSTRQITEAKSMILDLGLGNAEVHAMDFMALHGELGEFDYIIAHGVYSWVPRPVQDVLLAIMKRSLSPQGVCILNYCTYPGSYFHRISRDIMLYGVAGCEHPKDKVRRARNHLEAISRILPNKNNPYLSILGELQAAVAQRQDALLLHDDLGEIYDPLYFHEFVRRLGVAGLQYLGDADFVRRQLTRYPRQIAEQLSALGEDLIAYEQNTDFLFRQSSRYSIFCHEGLSLGDDVDVARLAPLYLSSLATPVPLPEQERKGLGFRGIWGNLVYDPDPLFQQAMHHLIEIYPRAVTFSSLLETLLAGRGAVGDECKQELAFRLLSARSQSVINITVDAPPVVSVAGERPMAYPLARYQATRYSEVTSVWHENVGLDDFGRCLLSHLDGSHDLEELQALMARDGCKGDLLRRISQQINFFAKSGLLIPAP